MVCESVSLGGARWRLNAGIIFLSRMVSAQSLSTFCWRLQVVNMELFLMLYLSYTRFGGQEDKV
jgi:hypothetical protein